MLCATKSTNAPQRGRGDGIERAGLQLQADIEYLGIRGNDESDETGVGMSPLSPFISPFKARDGDTGAT
jgi:hypothetical protein